MGAFLLDISLRGLSWVLSHPLSFLIMLQSSSVVDSKFLSEFELWSTQLIMIDLAFHPPQHTSGLDERRKTCYKVSTSFISSFLYVIWPISPFLSPHTPKLAATWPLPSNEGCRPPNVDLNWILGQGCVLGVGRKCKVRPMVWETCEVCEEGAVIGSPTFINFHSVYILTCLDMRCPLTHSALSCPHHHLLPCM